jgi:hypothetical protein
MLPILTILVTIIAIASFVCAIIVLIELFKQKGVGHGILGILCGLYPFIWGWMNATTLNLKKVMLYWTISIVAMMLLQGIIMAVAVSQGGTGLESPVPTETTP